MTTRSLCTLVALSALGLSIASGGFAQISRPDIPDPFALTDRNGDGTIDPDEFRMRMLDVFFFLDLDRDGKIVLSEVPDRHKDAFPEVDADSNGSVDLDEFLAFSGRRFAEADSSGDGRLSGAEVDAHRERMQAEAPPVGGLPPVGAFVLQVVTDSRLHPVPISEGYNAVAAVATITLSNEAGQGFLHGAAGSCVSMWPVYPTLSGETGYCHVVDAEGDAIFMRLKGDAGGDGFFGRGEATGGTGKYAGIDIEFNYDYVTKPLDDPLRISSSGTIRGRYVLQ